MHGTAERFVLVERDPVLGGASAVVGGGGVNSSGATARSASAKASKLVWYKLGVGCGTIVTFDMMASLHCVGLACRWDQHRRAVVLLTMIKYSISSSICQHFL